MSIDDTSALIGSRCHELAAGTLNGMRDPEIRLALESRLEGRKSSATNTLIRHELAVGQGVRRVDLAVVSGHLAGYEIKSDADTLARLEGQAEAYGRVFDYLTLVTTSRLLTKATERLPSWWGLIRADASSGNVKLEQVRPAKFNRSVDRMALAQLLWRDEAMALLRERGLAEGLSGKARWYVWERLAAEISTRELRALVRQTLMARQEWTDAQSPFQRGDLVRSYAIA